MSHSGLLLDAARLAELARHTPAPLGNYAEDKLRRRATTLLDSAQADGAEVSRFVAFVLEEVCGFDAAAGVWQRGSHVPPAEGRRIVTGETVKPRHLWKGPRGARLPVFLDDAARLGIGRSRRAVGQALAYLRAGREHLALLANGRHWRLLFAGMDFDASCQWDAESWFAQGELAPQVTALRTLLQPKLWTPAQDAAPPLLQGIRDTRKGQAELSEVLGERVREAVEVLIQGHGEALQERCANVDPADIYRAACRVAMRLVVALFAESRELLPRSNALYDASYGIEGLRSRLAAEAARGVALAESHAAWPRVLALFRLVYEGSHFPDLSVAAYGGELFAPGGSADTASADGVSQALAVFETTCFESECCNDWHVHHMLRLLTRTTMRIRQGRGSIRADVPVDFSDLSSEYIGIVYEGLLDYELKTAPAGDPVIFLAVGDQPALPLSRLEAMDDGALKALFASLKEAAATDAAAAPTTEDEPAADTAQHAAAEAEDSRRHNRTRAETWARRAARVAGLVPPLRQRAGQRAFEEALGRKAKQLVARVVLPGEWYLVLWGGTRKGSGSFYTRPGLAVPTVQRTLRPLAFDAPLDADGKPNEDAPPQAWTPKPPERILQLKVCDPACGSGTFPLAALRFLTDALYASLQHHGRIEAEGDRALIHLLGGERHGDANERLADELIPCRPDEDEFEPRLTAVLRRHVVERCIHAVDMDPLAVELCRLSLWIETMDRTLPFGFLDHKVKCGNALIGAWFDQFAHYPAMAWKHREGGDKNHGNGVHFPKNARTKALKAFVKERLTPDLRLFLRGPDLLQGDLLAEAGKAHDDALAVLAEMHALPIQDAKERAAKYRERFLGSTAWRSLKSAMDLWCACWFWPAEELDCAPLPRTFAAPSEETRTVAARLAQALRFFHWELEFPDVFDQPGAGFDAMLGNPPWDIAKPVSKEFFSNIDPLYRSYGKQEAIRRQSGYFEDAEVERDWLDYNARFRAQSNFMGRAAQPFGDPRSATGPNRFAIARGHENQRLHNEWRGARAQSTGYADPAHPFRHQGSADLNSYKLFLEATHALLRPGGRLGFVVPSGLYSDNGTAALRRLFLARCRWEWLFGFENREGLFPIHRSYKFNPVIVQKGGATAAIRTAFMRRSLDDWERAEALATPYAARQVARFSPKSRAILEIQSPRDLEILEKIYAPSHARGSPSRSPAEGSVLLGDGGPNGWGIHYAREFDMTNDSRLFPPRPQWEAQGYRPDEYSRWLLGDWRPIGELWAEMGVNASRPVAAAVELEDWLFDSSAGRERRAAEARLVHGHLLKPGDVARTNWRMRCAQPPYDGLPVPRAAILAGVVLSREGDAWIREDRVRGVALPVYVGKMIYVGQWAATPAAGSVGGRLDLDPEFLLDARDLRHRPSEGARVVFRDVARTTDTRSFISALLPGLYPCGNKTPLLGSPGSPSNTLDRKLALNAVITSLAFDWSVRQRMSGTTLNWHIVESLPLPVPESMPDQLRRWYARIALSGVQFAPDWLRFSADGAALHPPTPAERLRIAVMIDAAVAATMGLSESDLRHALTACDHPANHTGSRPPKGFWRVDKDKDPELRHTVLSLVAFHDLQAHVASAAGQQAGIEAFLSQHAGDGWQLPETLRLADYGLGHDDRAQHPQPVVSRLGPRFYDWQLGQSAEEARRERGVHARNLLGELDYARLLREGVSRLASMEEPLREVAEPRARYEISNAPADQQDILD